MRREVFEPSDIFVKRDNFIQIKINNEFITLYLVRIFMNSNPLDDNRTRLAYVNFEKKLAIELTMQDLDILKPQNVPDERWNRNEISCRHRPIRVEQSYKEDQKQLTKKYYELFALWEPCDHFGKKLID